MLPIGRQGEHLNGNIDLFSSATGNLAARLIAGGIFTAQPSNKRCGFSVSERD